MEGPAAPAGAGDVGAELSLVGFWPDYDRLILADAGCAELRIEVDDLTRFSRGGPLKKILRRMRTHHYLRAWAGRLAAPSDRVYLFRDNHHLLESLLACIGHLRGRRFFGGVLMRNPMSSNVQRSRVVQQLSSAGMRVWSFDPEDCRRYGFQYCPQFHRADLQIEASSCDSDLYFCGRSKGREMWLDRLRSLAEQSGLECRFVIKDKRERKLPYEEMLRDAARSRCIVDLIQDGQSGMTLRPFEALILDRRLVTNNPFVAAEPWYDPDRILLADTSLTAERLASFVNRSEDGATDARCWRSTYDVTSVLAQLRIQALEAPSVIV